MPPTGDDIRWRWMLACCVVLGTIGLAHSGRALALMACTVTPVRTRALGGRIDALLSGTLPGASGNPWVAALVGPPNGPIPYLLHDHLVLLAPSEHSLPVVIAVPSYLTPPTLLTTTVARRSLLVMIVDGTVWLIDPRQQRVVRRWQLDMQAIGWPAAAVVDSAGHLYLAGQPQQTRAALPAARIEDVDLTGTTPHVLWSKALGFYHAGVWVGQAGRGALAVYAPGEYDTPGHMLLLDRRTGALRWAFDVTAPPVASDSRAQLVYVADLTMVSLVSLTTGRAVLRGVGQVPLAIDSARGLIMYRNGTALIIGSARTLQRVARWRQPGLTAITVQPGGHIVMVGADNHLVWLLLSAGCRAT